MLEKARRRPAVGDEAVLAVHRVPEPAEGALLDLVVERRAANRGGAERRASDAGQRRCRRAAATSPARKLAAVDLASASRPSDRSSSGRPAPAREARPRRSSPSRASSSSRASARSPSSAMRTRTVVRPRCRASGMSSKPATATSSGTRMPAACEAPASRRSPYCRWRRRSRRTAACSASSARDRRFARLLLEIALDDLAVDAVRAGSLAKRRRALLRVDIVRWPGDVDEPLAAERDEMVDDGAHAGAHCRDGSPDACAAVRREC